MSTCLSTHVPLTTSTSTLSSPSATPILPLFTGVLSRSVPLLPYRKWQGMPLVLFPIPCVFPAGKIIQELLGRFLWDTVRLLLMWVTPGLLTFNSLWYHYCKIIGPTIILYLCLEFVLYVTSVSYSSCTSWNCLYLFDCTSCLTHTIPPQLLSTNSTIKDGHRQLWYVNPWRCVCWMLWVGSQTPQVCLGAVALVFSRKTHFNYSKGWDARLVRRLRWGTSESLVYSH